MKRAAVLLVVLLFFGACSNPPFSLRFALTDGDSQACIAESGDPTTDCSKVTTACDPVLSIRIIPPGDPNVPYISQCKPLLGAPNLCSIAYVDLPEPIVPVPEQVLEVQMAIFPKAQVPTDPLTNNLVCPIVQFGANNLPISVTCSGQDQTMCPPVPAVGGRAFYHPGDDKTVVKLGCTDPVQLQAMSCSGQNPIVVSASVTDFDDQQPVSSLLAPRLAVSIGEPKPFGDVYVFGATANSKAELTLVADSTWQGNVGLTFTQAVCVDVREDAAQSTATLTCNKLLMPVGSRIDATGVRMSKATLDAILAGVGKTAFPDRGIVIGIVLDATNTPLAGVSVTPASGTVKYLSANLGATVTGGTSTSGVFVSDDAPFGTEFVAQNSSLETVTGYGGLVDGKVNIIVIRFAPPSTGG